eukprot:jgi/Hompol1/3146/HPOL_003134-RA
MSDLVVPDERKRCAAGMTRLLTKSETMLNATYFPVWVALMPPVCELIANPIKSDASIPVQATPDLDDADVIAELAETGAGIGAPGAHGSFVRLAAVRFDSGATASAATAAAAADPTQLAQQLAQGIAGQARSHAGTIEPAVRQMEQQMLIPHVIAKRISESLHQAVYR